MAILLAARRPVGLLGLVLCATFATSPRPLLGPLVRPFVGPWPFRLYPLWKRLCPGTWADAAEVSQLVRPDVIAGRVRAVLSVDVRSALAASPVPVLYIRATRDWIVPAANLRRIRKVRPDVNVERIPSPHQVLQACPTESASAIGWFVQSTRP